jgi:SOS-response transcriptional repressor LexA
MKNKQPLQESFIPEKPLREFYDIPLLGEVKIEHHNSMTGKYSIGDIINNFRLNNTQTFSIQVMDKGMEASGIYRGDYLTVLLHDKITNGEIAVVRLSDKIYVRRLFYVNGFIRLETSSESRNPLIVEPSAPGFEIIGKVLSLIRAI